METGQKTQHGFKALRVAASVPVQGCGLITYKDRGSAGAAIQQLHGEYTFPGSDCPMVVEWMDLKKQRPAAVLPAVDKAPMGCAPDAFKLLLSNIPVSISESALISALSQFGHVVQLGLSQDPAGVSGTS